MNVGAGSYLTHDRVYMIIDEETEAYQQINFLVLIFVAEQPTSKRSGLKQKTQIISHNIVII